MSDRLSAGRQLLYLCGGRSFHSNSPGRKISEVVNCWRKAGFRINHVCGADIYDSGTRVGQDYGAQDTYSRWYRKLPVVSSLVTSLSEWRDIRHDKEMLRHLRGEFDRSKPEVIWERSSRLHNAGLILAREYKVPYVLEWKDNLVNYRMSLFRRKALKLEIKKNQESDYIVVESDVLREKLIEQGVDAKKILVAHNAVTASEFQPDQVNRTLTREKYGVTGRAVLVGYLGSYAFYHDTERLILAAKLLQGDRNARNIRIVMIGAGKEYELCREMAGKFGLLGGILMMNPGVPKEEVPDILAALDIAVLPGSTDIICPIKVQEYMACGLPVVVPDYLCNREVVDEGRTGLLFKPGSEEDLATKVMALATDEAQRKIIGRQAREEVQRRFSWERTWGAALQHIMQNI